MIGHCGNDNWCHRKSVDHQVRIKATARLAMIYTRWRYIRYTRWYTEGEDNLAIQKSFTESGKVAGLPVPHPEEEKEKRPGNGGELECGDGWRVLMTIATSMIILMSLTTLISGWQQGLARRRRRWRSGELDPKVKSRRRCRGNGGTKSWFDE